PEVEAALLSHAAVAECGVVGCPDEDRGQIVKAYVVLRPGQTGDTALTKALQDHVKSAIAPYKYPRAIEYVAELPKTQTGKLQRFELRGRAAEQAAHKLASCSGIATLALTTFKMPPDVPADDDDLPKALTPSAWPRPVGYANGMTAKGRVIVTAGLVGWDVMGNFPDGFVAQARQLFTNMLAVLAEGGAGPEHL